MSSTCFWLMNRRVLIAFLSKSYQLVNLSTRQLNYISLLLFSII